MRPEGKFYRESSRVSTGKVARRRSVSRELIWVVRAEKGSRRRPPPTLLTACVSRGLRGGMLLWRECLGEKLARVKCGPISAEIVGRHPGKVVVITLEKQHGAISADSAPLYTSSFNEYLDISYSCHFPLECCSMNTKTLLPMLRSSMICQ